MLFMNRLLVVLCIPQCFLFGLFWGLKFSPNIISDDFCHGGISTSTFNCSCSYFIEFSLPPPPNPIRNRATTTPLPRIPCDVLNIPHTTLNCTGNLFSDTCSYQCNEGFTNIAEKNGKEEAFDVLSCNEAGQWEGTLPVCSAITCESPKTPPNAKISCEDDILVYGMECEVECLEGYNNNLLSKTSVLTCDQDGFFSGPMPICEPVRCQALGLSKIENTQISCTGNSLGSACTYQCKENYVESEGSRIRICQSSGTWSGSQLSCEPGSCPELRTSSNYLVHCNGSVYGSTCNYQCGPGYRMVNGSQYRTCGTNGTWSGVQITCEIIKCQEVQSGVNYLVNCDGYNVGSECHYKCNVGYKLVGGSQISRCEANGEWSASHLRCEPIRCLELYTDKDSLYNVECNGSAIGSVCRYWCDAGYEVVSGSLTRSCDLNGEWTGLQPKCERESFLCPPLRTPPNSSIQCRNRTLNLICEYKCETKYKLTAGSQRRKCKSDGWSGKEAICTLITCPKLLPPKRGEIQCTTGNQVDSVCEYFCSPGFQLVGSTGSSRKCTTLGTWTGSHKAECTRIKCPGVNRLGVKDCNVTCTGRKYQDICRYNAIPGYQLVEGDSLRNCTSDGKWSGKKAVCQKIGKNLNIYHGPVTNCEALTAPENGNLMCTNTTTVGSIFCRYTCNKNYELVNGSLSRTCAEGAWNGSAPICYQTNRVTPRLPITTTHTITAITTLEPKIYEKCSLLPVPTNGEMACFTYPAYNIVKCKFQCFPGFLLRGPMEKICKRGSWSQNQSICLPLKYYNIPGHGSCHTLDMPKFSKMTCSHPGISTVPVGTVCRYYCQEGTRFSENSSSERVCLSNGEWSGDLPAREPICQPYYMAACPFPNVENNCIRMCSGCYRNGCRCAFKPKAGYYIANGSELRICVSGYWTGLDPICVRKSSIC